MNIRNFSIGVLWLLMPWMVMACAMGEVTPEGYENASIEHAMAHWKQGEGSPIPFQFC